MTYLYILNTGKVIWKVSTLPCCTFFVWYFYKNLWFRHSYTAYVWILQKLVSKLLKFIIKFVNTLAAELVKVSLNRKHRGRRIDISHVSLIYLSQSCNAWIFSERYIGHTITFSKLKLTFCLLDGFVFCLFSKFWRQLKPVQIWIDYINVISYQIYMAYKL